MKKRILAFLAAAVCAAGMLAGCGGQDANSSGASSEGTASGASQTTGGSGTGSAASEDGRVHVTFWHAMNTDLIPEIAGKFNESQDEVYVEALYQGAYGDVLNNFRMAMAAGGQDAPDIVQVYEGGSAFMIESGYATPVQTYIDEENYDLSDILPLIRNYYTYNGTMYSMPFNSSNAVLYYNKDMFRAAGLDPEAPPTTFEELGEYAKQLKTDGVAGVALPIDTSLFEFNMVNIGKEIVDNGNGRNARATKAVFSDNGGGLEVFQAYNGLYLTGATEDFGSDSLQAFMGQKTAMTISSSSLVSTVANTVGENFEVGVAQMPRTNPDVDCGIPVGGGTLWLANKGEPEKERAAFQFLKFMIEPETQAEWHMATGYYAISQKAYELESVKEFYEENPLFEVAVEQIMNSNTDAVGPVYAVNMEARSKIQDHWRAMMEQTETPEEAIRAAQDEVTALIEQYNATNPLP